MATNIARALEASQEGRTQKRVKFEPPKEFFTTSVMECGTSLFAPIDERKKGEQSDLDHKLPRVIQWNKRNYKLTQTLLRMSHKTILECLLALSCEEKFKGFEPKSGKLKITTTRYALTQSVFGGRSHHYYKSLEQKLEDLQHARIDGWAIVSDVISKDTQLEVWLSKEYLGFVQKGTPIDRRHYHNGFATLKQVKLKHRAAVVAILQSVLKDKPRYGKYGWFGRSLEGVMQELDIPEFYTPRQAVEIKSNFKNQLFLDVLMEHLRIEVVPTTDRRDWVIRPHKMKVKEHHE
ncbi:hypothetical protein [Helicobacter ailurogastricus]|uniref:hypothetical protein n=1 Tax=Helicobacter ailurogastricus TaxID=1578720 RepID=UPI0022C69D83|nr:hypothetical protein [Helicobacter ailurogastricus]GLH58653.1 hypothetical protein NHP214376_14480 [Helicobacter ailurogastricus]GLH60166.1 hypothetical protein NHP214377_14410 [Helicobacter ailurogastricus]